MQLVWEAYDLLQTRLGDVRLDADDEDKERSITFLLRICIGQCMTGDEPFCVVHEPPEQAARKGGRARPPQPDISFVLYANPRVTWPVEAKLLPTDKSVSRYVREVNDNFLTGRYAPFSAEGAMLGYLMSGDAGVAFDTIAAHFGCQLTHHPTFRERDHKLSRHNRDDLPHSDCPARFLCHHLLMQIGGKS